MNTTGRKTVKGRTTSAPKKIEKASATKGNGSTELSETAAEVSATAAAPPTASPVLKLAPTHEQIALRAYELFLARGSEPGHESEDWLAAEAELAV